jgi:glycyl-tRNA synthetase
LVDRAEKALWKAYQAASAGLAVAGSLDTFGRAFQPLVGPVDTFFEEVLVMAEDPDLRANRLKLLATLVAPGAGLVDWNAIADL